MDQLGNGRKLAVLRRAVIAVREWSEWRIPAFAMGRKLLTEPYDAMHGFGRPGRAKSILVVDEDQGALATMARLLRRAGYSVAEAQSGQEAVEAARSEPPSVVLLGVALPDGSGFEIYRELTDAFGRSLRVIFLSSSPADPGDEVAALLLGADDYVTKPFSPDVLLARVRRLADPTKSGAFEPPELTQRELEVLELLVDGRREAEIARDLYIAPKTVAKHIEHILRKLGVHSRAEAVALAARRGIVAEPAPRG
jgi:two-component system, NarL family, nitrate/nitrite response regulator NarL